MANRKNRGSHFFRGSNHRIRHPVVANRFRRAALPGFLSRGAFFGRGRLPMDIGKASFIVSREKIRRRIATKVTIGA
jgi:hypothetical protein